MKTLLGILTLTACGAAPRTSTPIAELAHAPGTTTSMTVQPVFFYTDSHGKPGDAASLTVAMPARASVTVAMPNKTQAIPACLLDTYELHLVLAYHLDGKTYGGSPGKPDVIAEQLSWPLAHGKSPAEK